MKHALAVLALALTALICGCAPALSIRPLYTDEDVKRSVVEPRIEGEWISTDPDEAGTPNELVGQWKVTAPDKTNTSMPYLIEFRPAKPGPMIPVPLTPDYTPAFPEDVAEAFRYDVRLVLIGDKLFFDADFQEAAVGSKKLSRETIVGMVPAHVLGRVWVESDLLRVALLDSEWVKQHMPEALWRSADLGDTNAALLTATTDELRKFLLENADNPEAVAPLYLCRPGTDCSLRMMNEELRTRPEDKEVLEDAAGFFTTRGDYAKAIELRRHAVLLAPKDAATHVHFGTALLFARDFGGARKEFTAVSDPTLKKPSACRYAMWSYFLEGKWTEVPQAAATCRASDDFWAAEAILLTYHSLRRLGRRDVAEAYLKEEAAKFEGAVDDHALLLDAEGRTGMWSPCRTGEDLRCKYFDALHEERSNGTRAKWLLQEIVNFAPKDHLMALAAKIELERLGPTAKKLGQD